MLTTYNEFKLGDRVYWYNDESQDSGTIVEKGGEVLFLSGEGDVRVHVKFDFDEEIFSVSTKQIIKAGETSSEQEEQKAVALLLSLGYTLSKNSK